MDVSLLLICGIVIYREYYLTFEQLGLGASLCKCETEKELFPQLLKILKVGPTNHLDGKVDTPLRNCGSR